MTIQNIGKAALIAIVAISVSAAHASAATHKSYRATTRVASTSADKLTPASFFVLAASMPLILGTSY